MVTLIPNSKWGGKGLLGAQVGRGYLHRLPKDCRNTLGVSFERKVCVDENNTTSCGAVDLKLNGVSSTTTTTRGCDNESNNNDMERKEILQKTENDQQRPPIVEESSNPQFDKLNISEKKVDDKVGERTLTTISNENDHHSTNITSSNSNQIVDLDRSTSPHSEDYESCNNPVMSHFEHVSNVSQFPSTPQLQDFTLIGLSRPSSGIFDNDLPPPPISYNLDDLQEEELAAVDLR